MKVHTTELPGVLVIEPRVFSDSRGFFLETFHRERYREAGIGEEFVQDNHSGSRRGTLRGLHYQRRKPQGKLFWVVRGEVFDVVVDLRRGAASFACHVSVTLSAESRRQLYVPPGFAHGFCVTSEFAEVAYKCTAFYDPADDAGVRWNDRQLAIAWPTGEPLLSEKDAALPLLSDAMLPDLVA